MKRFRGNPILKPIMGNSWESRMVFNAAALYAGGRVHILYRAVGDDGVSRLGYASSPDGYNIEERLPSPIFEPANNAEKDGCEDPRLTILDGRCIMCYTALRSRVLNAHQISMTSIAVEDLINKNWNWGDRWLPFPGVRNKDAGLFPRRINGRYVLFHRIDPDICVAYSDDLRRWCDIRAVMGPRFGMWDRWKIGIAGPPIELNEGWLLIYHGADFNRIYYLGAALLDEMKPDRVLHRSNKPILRPTEEYERFGKVPNVVFSCGVVLMDDQLLIYYGGADSVLCLATYDLSEVLPKK